MAEHEEKRKRCPHCGAELPEEASFCPYCARSVNQRQEKIPPSARWRKALRRAFIILVPLVLVIGAGAAWYRSVQPKVYDDGGTGEVLYTDEDGTYQILIGWRDTPYSPAPTITQDAELDEEYTFPVCLFINHKDTGVNAAGTFLRKVDSVTAEFGTPDDPSAYITYDKPAYSGYAPDAALTSFTHFLGRENSARGTWTITMDNGDVILLHQTLNVELIETVDIYPEDAPMDTIEALQTLVDSLGEQVGASDVVNIHLPAITYEGNLVISDRPVNLYGSAEGEGRTVFTGTIQVNPGGVNWITYLHDIEFAGNGDGVAVTAARRTWAIGCRFTGWRTAFLCHGTGATDGIAYTSCIFEDNDVAVHYNTNRINMFNSVCPDNAFLRNGTGLLIEGVPVEQALGLPGCRFEGNGTDIDNRSGQPLDISQAVFQ